MNAAERIAARRLAAGLPAFTCPSCGAHARHWVPEDLEHPGHYTCTTKGI